MCQREKGWTYEPEKLEIWEARHTTRGYWYASFTPMFELH